MLKIACFGCSFTHGYGQADCLGLTDPPSKFSWPAYLENIAGYKVENLGFMGASNQQIFKSFLDYSLTNSCNLAIVLWSFKDRVYFQNHSKQKTTSYRPGDTAHNKKLEWYYLNFHSDEAAILSQVACANALDTIAKSKGIKVLHDFLDIGITDRTHLMTLDTVDATTLNSFINFMYHNTDIPDSRRTASDREHPSSLVNELWVREKLIPRINNLVP